MKTKEEREREFMLAWNAMQAQIMRDHPGTDSELVYRMTDAWMKRTLGISSDHHRDPNPIG